jgi:hypothetical protein
MRGRWNQLCSTNSSIIVGIGLLNRGRTKVDFPLCCTITDCEPEAKPGARSQE